MIDAELFFNMNDFIKIYQASDFKDKKKIDLYCQENYNL